MKKLIVSLLMVGGVSATLAQSTIGSVTFATFNGGNLTRGQTFLPGTTTGPGTNGLAELWWSDTSSGSFLPMNSVNTGAPLPQRFSANTPSYVQDGSFTANAARIGGSIVFVEMRAWNASAGGSWAVAGGDTPGSNAALLWYGRTAAISRTLGGIDIDGLPVTPPNFNTFNNLTLTAVPEPSTVVLASLGLASLLIFRRRK